MIRTTLAEAKSTLPSLVETVHVLREERRRMRPQQDISTSENLETRRASLVRDGKSPFRAGRGARFGREVVLPRRSLAPSYPRQHGADCDDVFHDGCENRTNEPFCENY
jgi:hypothetical protein